MVANSREAMPLIAIIMWRYLHPTLQNVYNSVKKCTADRSILTSLYLMNDECNINRGNNAALSGITKLETFVLELIVGGKY